MLTIHKETRSGEMLLTLEGRLDTNTAPELERTILEDPDALRDLTLDFEKVDYISSAGLRVLLKAQKAVRGKGAMKLTGVVPNVMDVFEVTGLTEILTIE